MKTFLFVTAVLVGLASAFVERTPAPPRSTALGGGFLDGESKDHSVNRCDTKHYFFSPLVSLNPCFDQINAGSAKKNDIMKNEDDAMWVEDADDKTSGGGWNPFAIAKGLDDPKQAEARKARSKSPPPPPPEPKKSGGFKFPWDK